MARIFDTPLFSSDQSIERVLAAGLPVVLVFIDGAAQDGLDQAMKRVAKNEAGNLLVVQIPVKDSPETARRFEARSAPTVVTVRDGKVISRADGARGEDVERHANYLLGKAPRPDPQVDEARQNSQSAGAYRSSPSGQPGYTTGGPSTSRTSTGGVPVVVTDATFEQEVLRSPVPVVVDFWAPWCGPCRMVAPILDKLAREMDGRVKIAKVNVDENPRISGQHGIQAIPTMMLVKDGRIVDRWAGALPEAAMRSRLSKIIS